MFFAAGWFLRPYLVKESVPLHEKTPKQSSPDVDLQYALNKANSFLKSQQKSLDSLQVLNTSLSDRLLAVRQNDNTSAVRQPEEDQRIIRDTIYLAQVKVEQRIIEKVIRDTIILEVPTIGATEALADGGENMP